MSGPALIDREGALTYPELEVAVAGAAADLQQRGVRPGDRVVLVTSNDRHSVIAFHAVVRCGGVAVLTQSSAGASELRAAVEQTAPVLVVEDPATLGSSGPGSPDRLESPAAEDPDRPCVVVFSSGTTAAPKGVVHTARSLAGACASFAAMAGFTAADRAFLVSPLASITGVTQALAMAPAVGGTVVLEPAYDDERTLDLLLASGGTFYGGPDLVLDRLLAVAARRGVAVPLRTAALGGTMLRRELVDRVEEAGIRVIRVYGSSEVPWSTGTRTAEPDELRLHDEGTPGPGVELRLFENELLIRGPHLFAGYLDAEQTDAALDDGWFRTGDEAEIVDGRLRIVGRLKDVASRNGRKISLAEVDQAFTTATGITDCAAFVVPDEATGERVAMAVRAEHLDVPAALDHMRHQGLATYKLPESVVAWPGPLPTTATGKFQRKELTETGGTPLWRAERLGR